MSAIDEAARAEEARADGPPRGGRRPAAGAIALADTLKPHGREVVDRLGRQGASVFLLTGDNPATARAIAAELGLPAERVFAGVRPTARPRRWPSFAGAAARWRWSATA
ncbi:MAG: HAD family hydrolase [Singulisphaera sp.]